MTRDQITAMADAELVTAVAEQVMEWRAYQCESAYFNSWCNKDGEGEGPVGQWKPLVNWGHTWEVIEAMRAKGWSLDLCGRHDSIECGFLIGDKHFSVRANYGNERRAILEAALLAIQRAN